MFAALKKAKTQKHIFKAVSIMTRTIDFRKILIQHKNHANSSSENQF